MSGTRFWLLADTHFGHKKMMGYCGRPEGYEETIIKALMRCCINHNDVIIHLGDFCVYRDEYWHDQFMSHCMGRKWLIRGNHDRKSLTWYLAHGWNFVADQVVLNAFGKRIMLSHRPLPESPDWDLNIHGHLHNADHHPESKTSQIHQLIAMEHRYCPVNLRNIV